MEFFLPSVLVLLLAAGVVFFIFPRFGPLTLAVVSFILLGLGVYNHISQFGVEYRMSTWQLGMTSFAPYVLVGALLLAIIGYLTYVLTGTGKSANAVATPVNMPTIANMPPPETATNAVTAAINRGLNAAANVVGVNRRNNAGAAAAGNTGGLLATLTGANNRRNTGNANKPSGGNVPFSQI